MEKMRSVLFVITFTLTFTACFGQSWSDPITISHAGSNHNPSFTIDKDGGIHCVWAQKFTYNFKKIYYSKSTDDGLIWTDPIPITTNTDLWLDEPHIIADTSNNLYASYDYNVGGWPNSKICYVKFIAQSSTWSQQTEIATGISNRLVIDQDTRVYFFWFAGTEYYRYLDNDVLSDIISLSSWIEVDCFFDNFSVDKQNQIHCIGNRKAGDYSRGAYFPNINGNWSYVDLSNNSFYESGISLNSIGLHSFALIS